jgi:SAM-dependent methyltransferase
VSPSPRLIPLVPPAVRRLFRRVFPHREPDYARLWDRACQKWVLGETQLHKGHLHATGWLVAPPGLRPHVDFRVNDEPVDKVLYPLDRPDVAKLFGFVPGASASGFDVWKKLPDGTAELGDLTVAPVDRRSGRPLGWDYAAFHVPSAARFGPMPAPHQMARVIGAPSDFYFRMGGYTAFLALGQAVREATGAALTAYPRVLDWGCGCGRVSRYFLPLPGAAVTGVDVDPENVAWCRANLPGGAWDVVPLRPPTTLPAAGFDLAFGVSVFTHLKEPEQYAWLDELRRVLRPGGLALMTFHGDASLVWSRLSAERFTELRRDGFCEQANPLYDADLGEADYYRDVFHTTEYVRREWGKYFEVLAIKPTWVAHQDLAVMRRV